MVQAEGCIRRRLAALVLALVLLLSCAPAALASDLSVDAGFYLKQSRGGTCTLTSAAMMLRRRAYLDGLADWVDVTENNLRSTAWSGGLVHSFTYNSMRVGYATLPSGLEAKTQQLISLLEAHPEGIVLYDRTQPHAVLLTDYTDGVFYCADPAGNIGVGRVPITSSLVSIARASCYWYIVEDTNSLSAAVQTNQLQIEGMVYPLNIHLGSGMSLKGLARSTEGAVLTDVEVAILDVMDQVVQSAQAQLDGTQSSWSFCEVDNQILFGQLPEGSYTFMVAAEDSAGQTLYFVNDFTVSSASASSGVYWSAQDGSQPIPEPEQPAESVETEQAPDFWDMLEEWFFG